MHSKKPVQAGWGYEIASICRHKDRLWHSDSASWAQAKSRQGINCHLPQGVERVRNVQHPGGKHELLLWLIGVTERT